MAYYWVEEGGGRVGRVLVEEEGLFRRVSARVRAPEGDRGAVLRLGAETGDGPRPLGVLMPEGADLTLEKRWSRTAWAALGLAEPLCFCLLRGEGAGTPQDGWRRCPDVGAFFAEAELAALFSRCGEVWLRDEGDARQISVPVERDRPFPLLPLFCFASPTLLGGKLYYVFRERDGVIVVDSI